MNKYATASLVQTLNNIFDHPNVGPFVSKLLIQHLVTSDPSPAMTGRVSAVFNANRARFDADLKSVVRAILLDPEVRGDAKTDPNFGKLREPVQLMTNMALSSDVMNFAGTGPSDGEFYRRPATSAYGARRRFTRRRSSTIFRRIIRSGNDAARAYFGLTTTGTSIARANFANTMIYTGINVSNPPVNVPAGTRFNFAEMQALAAADRREPAARRVELQNDAQHDVAADAKHRPDGRYRHRRFEPAGAVRSRRCISLSRHRNIRYRGEKHE